MELRKNLQKILDQNTDRDTKNKSQLYTHYHGTLQSPWNTLPDVKGHFTYNVDKETGSVTWEITENASEEISINIPTFQITSNDYSNTKQKLVAEYFKGEMNTDVSWSAIDPKINNKYNPDMILQLGTKLWLVLGIGTTTASGSNDSLRNEYKSKFVQLKPTISQILQNDPDIHIYLWIVIVAPTEVYTTFRLDADAVDELVFRFRIGTAMEDVLNQLGLYTAINTELTEEQHAAEKSISSLAAAAMNGCDDSINEHSVNNFKNFVPDRQYITDSINFMTEEISKLSKSKQESMDEMNEAFAQVEREIVKIGNERTDLKGIVQMPFFTAETSLEQNDFLSVHALPSDSLPVVVDHVWREAHKSRISNPSRFKRSTLEQEFETAVNEGYSDEPDSVCNNLFKVDVELSQDHKKILALDGLFGKRYDNHDFSIQRKAHQHKGFSLDCDTTDIEDCLKIKPKPCNIPNLYMEKLEPLLAKATNLAGNKTKGLGLLKELMSTDVTLALCQMSAVAQELSVSLREKVSEEKWIFKKVLHYDIEMLIKPTRPGSHIFFLLRFRGSPLEKSAFRKVYHHENWWYTDLLSINESRLNNFIKVPALYLNILIHFRMNVSRMKQEDIGQTSPDGYSETIAMLTLLLALEDKSTTEEMALNVRYLIMQFSKGADLLSMPRPGLAVLKIPAFLRSRLAVYLYKQIKIYCSKQWETLPVKVDHKMGEDCSSVCFRNLLCPYTHTELLTFYDAVQVMYIAYAKNKNAKTEHNADYGLVKKVAEHCLNVDPAKKNKYNGSEDPDPGLPGPHEFSPSFLSEACSLLKQKFKTQYGKNWAQLVKTEILKQLVQTSHYESLATLKASASFSQNKCIGSCKCIEAVIRELELDKIFHPLLIQDYTRIYKDIMSETGGICCYMFKKNQHGGLREIYVMTFKSRLLQILPEVAAKVLCLMCPEEVLTHPDKKTAGYERHHTNIISASEKTLSTEIVHRTSSEDKSKWSQGMNVNAFAFMFAQLLPSELAHAIARVMHSFRNKKIAIPKTVVNIFKKQVKLKIDTYAIMQNDFSKGSESEHFVTIGNTVLMKTPTGMWQGILHYCSSLLHVLQTVHYKNMCRLYFKTACDKMAKSSNAEFQGRKALGVLLIDTVVGSDDSATYGSIVLPQGCSPDVRLKADQVLDFLLKLEVFHSRFFMMVESSKSTISSRTVGEFNSVFMCPNAIIISLIKKVLSVTTTPRCEDLHNRQVEMSNALNDLVEHGAGHFQIHLTELVNSFLHYSTFGLCTSRLFLSWTDMIVSHPDPHLGFLLLDLQDIAGTFTFDFKRYNSLIGTKVPVIPNNTAELHSKPNKSFVVGVTALTNTKKWQTFKDKLIWPSDWKKYLERNPHVLYMERGQTREQIRARLSATVSSKEVYNFFNDNRSISLLISKSVYLLSKRLVSQFDYDNISEYSISSTRKESLLQLTQKRINNVENDPRFAHCNLTQNQVILHYPNHLLYKAVSQAVEAARGESDLVKAIINNNIKCKRLKGRTGATNDIFLTLMTVVRWKWLSHSATHAHAVLEYFWNRYIDIFPWLRETLEETLTESPFNSHIGLCDFIKELDVNASESEVNVLSRDILS